MPEQNLNQNIDNLRKRYRRYYTFLDPIVNKPQAKAFTFLALSFFTVAFFVFFAIRPTLNTIYGLKKQIDDNRIVEKKLQEKITALSQLQAEYEIIQPQLPVLNAALPTKANIADLVKMVEKIANDNQASLAAEQIGDTDLSETKNSNPKMTPNANTEAGNTVVPISLLFTTEGDFSKLSQLTAELNHLPRLLSTQTISMVKGLGKVVATLRVNAYYLPVK